MQFHLEYVNVLVSIHNTRPYIIDLRTKSNLSQIIIPWLQTLFFLLHIAIKYHSVTAPGKVQRVQW